MYMLPGVAYDNTASVAFDFRADHDGSVRSSLTSTDTMSVVLLSVFKNERGAVGGNREVQPSVVNLDAIATMISTLHYYYT